MTTSARASTSTSSSRRRERIRTRPIGFVVRRSCRTAWAGLGDGTGRTPGRTVTNWTGDVHVMSATSAPENAGLAATSRPSTTSTTIASPTRPAPSGGHDASRHLPAERGPRREDRPREPLAGPHHQRPPRPPRPVGRRGRRPRRLRTRPTRRPRRPSSPAPAAGRPRPHRRPRRPGGPPRRAAPPRPAAGPARAGPRRPAARSAPASRPARPARTRPNGRLPRPGPRRHCPAGRRQRAAPRAAKASTAAATWSATDPDNTRASRSWCMTRTAPTTVGLPAMPHGPSPRSADVSRRNRSADTARRPSGSTLHGSHSRSATETTAGRVMSTSSEPSSSSRSSSSPPSTSSRRRGATRERHARQLRQLRADLSGVTVRRIPTDEHEIERPLVGQCGRQRPGRRQRVRPDERRVADVHAGVRPPRHRLPEDVLRRRRPEREDRARPARRPRPAPLPSTPPAGSTGSSPASCHPGPGGRPCLAPATPPPGPA